MNLIQLCVAATQNQEHPIRSDTTMMAIRIPYSLRDIAAETANFRGMSFSTFARMQMIDAFVEKRC